MITERHMVGADIIEAILERNLNISSTGAGYDCAVAIAKALEGLKKGWKPCFGVDTKELVVARLEDWYFDTADDKQHALEFIYNFNIKRYVGQYTPLDAFYNNKEDVPVRENIWG